MNDDLTLLTRALTADADAAHSDAETVLQTVMSAIRHPGPASRRPHRRSVLAVAASATVLATVAAGVGAAGYLDHHHSGNRTPAIPGLAAALATSPLVGSHEAHASAVDPATHEVTYLASLTNASAETLGIDYPVRVYDADNQPVDVVAADLTRSVANAASTDGGPPPVANVIHPHESIRVWFRVRLDCDAPSTRWRNGAPVVVIALHGRTDPAATRFADLHAPSGSEGLDVPFVDLADAACPGS